MSHNMYQSQETNTPGARHVVEEIKRAPHSTYSEMLLPSKIKQTVTQKFPTPYLNFVHTNLAVLYCGSSGDNKTRDIILITGIMSFILMCYKA